MSDRTCERVVFLVTYSEIADRIRESASAYTPLQLDS
jgi:hypothetical protein